MLKLDFAYACPQSLLFKSIPTEGGLSNLSSSFNCWDYVGNIVKKIHDLFIQ